MRTRRAGKPRPPGWRGGLSRAPCLIIGSNPAPGGHSYSRYGPLQSLAATPLYALGRLVAGDDPVARWFTTRFFAVLLNALVTAATATVLYGLARSLGYGPRIALATALLYGLGSQAWPRAKTFFAEPLTTLLLLGAVACWWQLERARGEGRRARGEGRGARGEGRGARGDEEYPSKAGLM